MSNINLSSHAFPSVLRQGRDPGGWDMQTAALRNKHRTCPARAQNRTCTASLMLCQAA